MVADPRLITPRECEYALRHTGRDIPKKPLLRIQSPKVPLLDVVYERYSVGQKLSFYLRALPSRRPYSDNIKQFDKLLLLGIYDHKTAQKTEFAFSWKDQVAMLKGVCEVMVKASERQKLIDQFQLATNEFIQHGMIHQAFAEAEP